MAGTIKEIAEKAGVSRGTVDRALNNRGRVNPEVAERIFEIAREMNYQPKRKKKVYNQGKKIRIGVITQLAKSSFVKTIHAGIDKAEQELEEFGVEIIRKQIDGVSEDAQLEALEELSLLMDDVRNGEYVPDHLTTQPARAAIAKATGEV